MIEWTLATVRLKRLLRFWHSWEFIGYKPDDPTPVRRMGFTYTAWGARRALRRAMLR